MLWLCVDDVFIENQLVAGGSATVLVQVLVTGGWHVGCPKLECMESVPSYKFISGSAFARLIQKGSFQFIKGRYFEDCWRDQQVFACWQNIPREYLWTGDECVKLWEAHGPRFMLSISYGWLHEDHPDPEMSHLKRLAKVVKAFKKFHSIDIGDCAVFLYFCGLWQKELVDGVDTRTPEQIVQFKEALDEINTPYGHEAITSVRLEAMPEGTVRTYHMCKEYISNYRKWLRKLHLQHEQHPHER